MLQRVMSAQSRAQLVLVDEADSHDAAVAFLNALGVHQVSLLDADLRAGHAYGVIALPTTIFVRADGSIAGRQVGQLDERVLAAQLSNLGSP
jgi:hypothetical protein